MQINSDVVLQWKTKRYLCSLCYFYAEKLLLSLVLIDVSVSNSLNCEIEERLIITVVTSEMFVLNVCQH